MTQRDHLRKNGISTLKKFTEHVKNIEFDFWKNRFAEYKRWKQETFKVYERKGYVDLYTGFRIYGPMSFTEVANYPIQGSAFHVLLFSLIKRIYKAMQNAKLNSKIIGQIHDAIVMDVDPNEEKLIDDIVYTNGVLAPRKKWDWIIVPIAIEKERSQINGRWSEMESCGKLTEVSNDDRS